MSNTIELSARQLYLLGKAGSVRLLMPSKAMTCCVGGCVGDTYHVDGTDLNVIVTDSGVMSPDQISLTHLQESGFLAEIPPICKDFSPTEKQKAAYKSMTTVQKDEFIQNLARHCYMGWCDVADKVFARFTEDWKRRYPDDADLVERDNGRIRYAVFKFDHFD